ncbi:hypothetical protein Tco_0000472 [Tanacetum coccineum]
MATSSSSIDSKLKSPTSSPSPSTNGYLNSPILRAEGVIICQNIFAVSRHDTSISTLSSFTLPKSPSSRILKARYFPRSCFLDARIGYKPSFIWRNLCLARDIIRKGQKSNVGNGKKVRIWDDYWLEGYRILLTTIKIRICMLLMIFWIPLQKGGIIDYCHKFFPAKLQTGYHVYISILLFVILVTEMLLRMIYSLENLRIGLHVRTYNLLARGLTPGPLNCVHCSAPTEDIKHALFLSDWARGIWASVELDLLTNEAVDISIKDVLCATQE